MYVWQVNSHKITFDNCDNEPNSYVALFAKSGKKKHHHHGSGNTYPVCTDVLNAVDDCDTEMNEKYFIKTRWGGCDCYIQEDGEHKRYKRDDSGSGSDSDSSDSGSHSGSDDDDDNDKKHKKARRYKRDDSGSRSDDSDHDKKHKKHKHHKKHKGHKKSSIMFTAIGFK